MHTRFFLRTKTRLSNVPLLGCRLFAELFVTLPAVMLPAGLFMMATHRISSNEKHNRNNTAYKPKSVARD